MAVQLGLCRTWLETEDRFSNDVAHLTYLYVVAMENTSCVGNSSISLIGLYLSSGYGSTFHRSAVRTCRGSSGHGEMSSFSVPGMHLTRFKTLEGLLMSIKYLYRSSSLNLSPSCIIEAL